LGQVNPLLSAVPVWSRLGQAEAARQAFWRQWLQEALTERELAAIRRSLTTGRPFGSEGWALGMGQRLGLSLAPKQRGRPPKHRPGQPQELAPTK
jgi:hypothetical protein